MLVTDLVEPPLFGSAMAVMIFTWQITAMLQSLLIGYLLNNVQGVLMYPLVFGVIVFGSLLGSAALLSMREQGEQ